MVSQKPSKPGSRGIESPYLSLSQAIELLRLIKDKIGSRPTTISEIATCIKMSPKGSGFIRKMASLNQYGFIERDKDHVEFSNLAKSILYPVSPDAPAIASKKAFLHFELFQSFIQKYSGGYLPEIEYLANEFGGKGVGDASKKRAALNFIESAKFADFIVEKDGKLLVISVKEPADKKEQPSEGEAVPPKLQPEEDMFVHTVMVSEKRIIKIPLYKDLTREDVEKICRTLKQQLNYE